MVGWSSPIRLRDLILMRSLPKRLCRTYFSHINKGGGSEVISMDYYELVNYWHVDAAMALPLGKTSVVVCHGLEILESNVKDYKRGDFLTTLRGAGKIVANSRYTKQYLQSHYLIDPGKITVINPGIDLSVFDFIPHGNSGEMFVIGTLTRLVERKNISNIIRALVLLKNEYKVQFIYKLAGDGPELKRVMGELARSEINFEYLGAITENEKVNVFYPSLDVFVLPPLETSESVEGFGIVFLEANACGVPVVAADTGGVSDAVKDSVSGLFANPRDPIDIARKIFEILAAKDDYRRSSREWAENFSQEITARKFLELYDEIILPPI
jgi:phosphatidylinositol alpha-1,6-mannosyltransferase